MGDSFGLMFALIPLVIMATGLWMAFTALRDLLLRRRLLGHPSTTGRVISASMVYSRSSSGNGPSREHPSHFAETIEFTTPSGQRVRGIPAVQAGGLTDRTGMDVRVHADPERPERFIAPMDGVGPMVRLLGRVATGVIVVVFCIGFLTVAGGIGEISSGVSGRF